MLLKNFHCHLGVVQRSRKQTAFGFAAYGACTYFNDGYRRGNYGRDAGSHIGTVILLPPEAPAEFADEGVFLLALSAERRHDAQEGRTLTFAIPRVVPKEWQTAVAAFVLAPFAEMGMAIRFDIESPLASDGLPNPHGHALLAQRAVDRLGFGLKCPPWDRLFRLNSGRHVRAIVAARLTLACAILGFPDHCDPRRNDERGLHPAEPRMRGTIWKRQKDGVPVRELEDLNQRRRDRSTAAAETRNDTSVALSPGLAVSNVVLRNLKGEKGEAAVSAMADFFTRIGIATHRVDGALRVEAGPGETLLCSPGRIVADRGVSPAVARIMAGCARALDWSAVVADGDQDSVDNLIVAGIPEELAVVNRPASSGALSVIRRQHGDLLLQTTRAYDRLGTVARTVRLHQAARFWRAWPAVRNLPNGQQHWLHSRSCRRGLRLRKTPIEEGLPRSFMTLLHTKRTTGRQPRHPSYPSDLIKRADRRINSLGHNW